MRKMMMLLLLALTAATGAKADDYGYLTFVQGDGTVKSLPSSGLTITFASGKAVVTSGSDTAEFTLTALTRMLFTAEAATTGIETVSTSASAAPVEVYALSGVRLGSYAESSLSEVLPRGVYIVKANGVTRKMTVK